MYALLVAAGLIAAPLMIVNAGLAGGQGKGNCDQVEDGFLTGTAPYMDVVDTQHDGVTAIMTYGDRLDNGYSFSKIPDGLGAIHDTCDRVHVYLNHELANAANHGGYAKVSHLVLNEKTGGVLDGSYPIDGTQGYARLCSASDVEGYGFDHPLFLTNEEVDGGLALAVDHVTQEVIELPWLGFMAHENTIHVPYFYQSAGLTVIITLEDGAATESEVYMYVADSPEDLLDGNGQLYVLGASDRATFAQWDDLYYSHGWIDMEWIGLDWDWQTQDGDDLDDEAIAAGAFQFIRPEDGAMDKRNARANTLYFVDTGNNVDEDNNDIPAGSNGQEFEKGRAFELVFTDVDDPTQSRMRIFLDGDDASAPGYNVMINPDNIDTSRKSLMIQEDRIGVNRPAATNPYDITQNAKVLRYDLSSGNLEVVAYVNQDASPNARHGDWESTGILDASEHFGPGAWLVNVQAHALNEGGQLLLLEVNGS